MRTDPRSMSDEELQLKLAKAQINAQRHLLLWRSVGWTLATVATIIGAGYMIGGNRFAESPSLYVLRTYGGMHLYGGGMTVVGLVFLFTLGTGFRLTRGILEVFCGYCLLWSFSIFASWLLTGKVVFGAPWYPLAFFFFAAALILYPPIGYRERR